MVPKGGAVVRLLLFEQTEIRASILGNNMKFGAAAAVGLFATVASAVKVDQSDFDTLYQVFAVNDIDGVNAKRCFAKRSGAQKNRFDCPTCEFKRNGAFECDETSGKITAMYEGGKAKLNGPLDMQLLVTLEDLEHIHFKPQDNPNLVLVNGDSTNCFDRTMNEAFYVDPAAYCVFQDGEVSHPILGDFYAEMQSGNAGAEWCTSNSHVTDCDRVTGLPSSVEISSSADFDFTFEDVEELEDILNALGPELEEIDLSGLTGALTSEKCVSVERCNEDGVTCTFPMGLPYCKPPRAECTEFRSIDDCVGESRSAECYWKGRSCQHRLACTDFDVLSSFCDPEQAGSRSGVRKVCKKTKRLNRACKRNKAELCDIDPETKRCRAAADICNDCSIANMPTGTENERKGCCISSSEGRRKVCKWDRTDGTCLTKKASRSIPLR